MKNSLLTPVVLVAVLAVSSYLQPSVAELRSAASQAAVSSPGFEKVIMGPRRHSARVQVIAETDPLRPLSPLNPLTNHLLQMLDASGIHSDQRVLAQQVLGLLDPACQEKLQTFVVRYDHPKDRGLAGRGVIIVSGDVPDEEFMGLLLHEGLGHFRDLTCLMGTPQSGASEFHDGVDAIWNDDPSVLFYRISWVNEHQRKAAARPEDFVSGYAYQADNFEDVAESVTYYMTQEDAFRQRAKSNAALAAKLAWLETYMPKKAPVATGTAWNGEIAWDATKLAFMWVKQD